MILPFNTVIKRIFESWDHGYKYSCTMSILILRIFEHTFNTLAESSCFEDKENSQDNNSMQIFSSQDNNMQIFSR